MACNLGEGRFYSPEIVVCNGGFRFQNRSTYPTPEFDLSGLKCDILLRRVFTIRLAAMSPTGGCGCEKRCVQKRSVGESMTMDYYHGSYGG